MKIPRSTASVAMSLLLVVGLIAVGPAAGTASAETEVSSDCSVADLALGGAYTVINPQDSCGVYNDKQGEIAATDAYANALAMTDKADAYWTTRSNTQQDVEGLMWMKGKSAAITAINNGATESEAAEAFNQSVDEYTSRLVVNDMQFYTAQATQIAYLSNATGGSPGSPGSNFYHYASTANVTYQLPNGENHTARALLVDASGDDKLRDPFIYVDDNTGGEFTRVNRTWEHGSIDAEGHGRIFGGSAVEDPNSDSNIHPQKNKKTGNVALGWIESGEQVKTNGQEWISNATDAIEAGQIESGDLWDPVTLAQEASTERDSTGYYSFANSELSALGLTGATNVSHVVQTDITRSYYRNGSYVEASVSATIEGTLFLTGDDNMSLQTGSTYNPDNLNGDVYITVASAENSTTGEPINLSSRERLTEPFTILEATNTKTGESVNVTSAESKNYDTADVSRLQEQIDRLMRQREALEQGDATGGNGSSESDDSSQSGINPAALVLIVAGAGVIGLLLQRDGDRR